MDNSTKQEELHNLIAQSLSYVLNQAKENMIDILVSDEFACEPLEAKKLVDNGVYGKVIQNAIDVLKSEIDTLNNKHNDLGQLRGWIKKERRTMIDHYFNPETEEPAYHFDDFLILLSKIKSKTKHLMNGQNILKQRICKYEQTDEKYYCLEAIDFGFDYCYDHWQLVKLEREDDE